MKERTLSFVFLLFSFIYSFSARELSFGSIEAPKAGFLPMISGSIAVVLSIAIIVGEWMSVRGPKQEEVNWRKFIFVFIGLVLYVVLLSITGYIAASFIIMFYLLKVSDTAGWMIPGLISAGVAISFYVVFVQLLAINLP